MISGFKAAAAAAIMVASAAVPAVGAVIVNSANSGYNFVINYDGFVNEAPTDKVSALANFTFNGVTNNGRTYNFGYSMTNDSLVASRIRSFGMDTTGTLSSLSATGSYWGTATNAQFPGIPGGSNLDLCFIATTNGQCNGGSGGVTQGQTGAGTFALTFSQVMEAVTFDNFAVRFQSINPKVNGSSSGLGLGVLVDNGSSNNGPVSTAPEPTTWMMMLIGFGLVGFALRRRPIPGRQLQIA